MITITCEKPAPLGLGVSDIMGIVKGDFTSYIEKFISLGLNIM